MITAQTIQLLDAERERQHRKFGSEPLAVTDAAIRIIGEEFGEACKAVNQGASTEEFKAELVQLAAVCIAFLDNDLHDGNAK